MMVKKSLTIAVCALLFITVMGQSSNDIEALTGVVWQWQTELLENSARYTIEFMEGQMLAVRADCNRGRSTYVLQGDGKLQIVPPSLTRAACPPGSLDGRFIEQLVSSESYALKDGRLTLYPVVEPGVMVFVPSSEVREK